MQEVCLDDIYLAHAKPWASCPTPEGRKRKKKGEERQEGEKKRGESREREVTKDALGSLSGTPKQTQ